MDADAPGDGDGDDDLLRALHRTVFDVTNGVESFGFNAAIARLYAFTNILAKSKATHAAQRQAVMTLAQLMAPMTPHLAEEVWARQDGAGLIAQAPWPVADETLLTDDTVTLPIQIDGKRKSEMTVAKDADREEVERIALADAAVVKALTGGRPKKVIVVPNRIVNVVL